MNQPDTHDLDARLEDLRPLRLAAVHIELNVKPGQYSGVVSAGFDAVKRWGHATGTSQGAIFDMGIPHGEGDRLEAYDCGVDVPTRVAADPPLIAIHHVRWSVCAVAREGSGGDRPDDRTIPSLLAA